MTKIAKLSALVVLSALFIFPHSKCYANNLNISNVVLSDRNPSVKTIIVQFDLSWENSWRTKINHDAVWVTVRLYDPSVTPTNKKLCQLTDFGLNPAGTFPGSNEQIEISVPTDSYGAFIRLADYGTSALVESEGVELRVDYDSCGFDSDADVQASVLGIEMVYVPEGAFRAGDQTSTASLNEGTSDTNPWYISSESAINVTNTASNGYHYVSGGNVGEDATSSSFILAADYPKGYGAFYAMKYELTEGLWVEFINSLPTAARANHDITDVNHKSTDTVKFRNTISCSGSPVICTTSRPARPVNYISWMDLAAFLDWAALRPMSELEFEKMARGPELSVSGEFAWGAASITAATAISSGAEDGTETIATSGANAHYDNQTLTGGDTTGGSDYAQGPVRAGIFATENSTRQTSGAGYYGAMELSGNLSERVITIGNSSGRDFQGTHGDGVLSDESGYEGYATNSDWAGIDGTPSRGVTGADGSGFRGGSWSDASSGARLRVSDRLDAANASTAAFNNVGGRGVRTDE